MTKATLESRSNLLKQLIEIPSITESEYEADAAGFIHAYFKKLAYFTSHPEHLSLLATPLEQDPRSLFTVCARVMAKQPTKKTVIFIGHYDVVETSMYGELEPLAFQPDLLTKAFKESPHFLSKQAQSDLESGHFIFGRGAMDMKAGLAIEMELLRDFSEGAIAFDVNLLFLAVPDEENTSAGMRGALQYLTELQEQEGLEYIAGINTEPSSCCPEGTAGENVLFTGTIGKISPFFYSLGESSHVGNYYAGLSAALIASHIITLAEAQPELVDSLPNFVCPTWCCLENRVIRDGYSVTLPSRNITYFNTFSVTKTATQILDEMTEIAKNAARKTLAHLDEAESQMLQKGSSLPKDRPRQIEIYTVKELIQKAAERLGSIEKLQLEIMKINSALLFDVRERELSLLEMIYRHSALTGPAIIIGFLPTYYPFRTCRKNSSIDQALIHAIPKIVKKAVEDFGESLKIVEVFSGICDLSYLGFQGNTEELLCFSENLPSQGENAKIPIAELAKLDMPIFNLGPRGYDAHQIGERLDTRYSFDILPELLTYAIQVISEEFRLIK